MKQKLKYFTILFIVNLILAFQVKAQVYPVQLNTQLIPPYSLRLSDYVAPGTNRVGLNMLLTDLNEVNYQVRLELTIEGNGITIKTSPLFNPSPIILDGGVPQYFTSSDLAEWFDPNNLEFSGYSKSAYLSSGRLPEGVYRFSFTAYDYNKHIRVSNYIPVTAWLVLNDPPLFNLPLPDYKVERIDPQHIVFQWTPRHTASPNSAFSAEYEFTLVEIWPEGRDPNNAIQTSIPIFETTTTSTTLIYGLAEPFLQPGRQYAYRVQARDIDGRDMFKNKGYSEVRMFTFGQECKPITNINAEVIRYNEARITWTPGFTNTSFTVRYRSANSPDAEWFSENRMVSEVTLKDLQAQTTYEYQVMAYCGTYEGEYSDLKTFTTPEPKLASFECGKSADSTLVANTSPLPMLRKRDFISSGDFMVQITEVSGGNGNFSGKGLALVPYLGFVKLAVEFENIKVNTEKQVFEGEIKSVYNPNSPFIFTVDLDGPDYDTSGDSTFIAGTDGLNDTTLITDIDSIFIEGNDIIIVNEDGTTDTIHTTDNIIITDSNGDTWIVDNGTVVTGGGTGTGSGSGTGTIPVADVNDIKIKLEFLPYKDQEYGFDKLSYDIHNDMYEQASVYGESVYLPWKSLSAASMDRILVKFSDFDTTITPEKVRFRNAVGENLTSYAFEGKNDQRLVLLNGQTSLEAQTIEAYVAFKDTSNKEQELVVGKFNTISYEKENINVVLVPVNGPSPFAVADFVNALNDIYKQAAISWTVTMQSQYDIDKSEWDLDDDNKLNDGESTLLSSYSDEQNKLRRKYKSDRDIDNKTYYVFLLNGINSKTGLAGYMPIKGQYGFIYSGSTDARTIAHELGHGAFRLWHTFSTENKYIMAQNSSDNLMDYNNGQRLHKYQWDYIHNPETVLFDFLQDEEEGAITLSNNIIDAIREANNSYTDYTKVDKNWKVNENISVPLDNAPLLPTIITTSILKNDINILSKIYNKEEINNGKEVLLKFYNQNNKDQIAVTFKLPKEKTGTFLQYLGIVDLFVSGDVEFLDKQAVAFIKEDLKMPKLKFEINIDPVPDTKLIINYYLKCSMMYKGKYLNNKLPDEKDWDYPAGLSISGKVESTTKTIELDLGSIPQGGDLYITWKYGTLTGKKVILVRGKNPSKTNIINEAQKYTQRFWFFDKIVGHESSLRQFMNTGQYAPIDTSKRYVVDRIKNELTDHDKIQRGLPLYGPPRGIGLCQLDNWGNGGPQSIHLWNWKKNIEAAANEVLHEKVGAVKTDVKNLKLAFKFGDDENADTIIYKVNDFTVGDYTFKVKNSSLITDIDFKVAPNTDTKTKSFLDAAVIVRYNGGSIIESITYNTETIMHPKKNRPIKVLNITINYNTNKIYDNTDPKKKPYLFKVLGKP